MSFLRILDFSILCQNNKGVVFMKKEHGRLKPADSTEYAKVEGKVMLCPKCHFRQVVASVIFAETRCTECGTLMVEQGSEEAKLNNRV